MTYIFKLLGAGDVMTGMTYAVYIFTGIIGLIAIVSLSIAIMNYMKSQKKKSVSLKSKQAEKKQAEASKGLFNYDILAGDDEDFGVDITDPRNRNKQNGRHRKNLNRTPRKGMKAASNDSKKLSVQSNAPKVGLRRQQTTVNSNANTAPAPQSFDYDNMSGTIDNGYDANQNADTGMNAPDAYNNGMMQFDDVSGSIQPSSMNGSDADSYTSNQSAMSFDDNGIQLENMNPASPAPYQQSQPPVMNPVNPTMQPQPVSNNDGMVNPPIIHVPQPINGNVNMSNQNARQNGDSNPFMSSDGSQSSMHANPFAHIINPDDMH